jgi:hypothetical protein
MTKTLNGPPLQKVLDLSTGHLPGPDPDFGDLRVTEHEYGWIIFVPGLGAGELEDIDIPEWARPLVSYAVSTDCLLINFDQAGDRFDGWTVYDW